MNFSFIYRMRCYLHYFYLIFNSTLVVLFFCKGKMQERRNRTLGNLQEISNLANQWPARIFRSVVLSIQDWKCGSMIYGSLRRGLSEIRVNNILGKKWNTLWQDLNSAKALRWTCLLFFLRSICQKEHKIEKLSEHSKFLINWQIKMKCFGNTYIPHSQCDLAGCSKLNLCPANSSGIWCCRRKYHHRVPRKHLSFLILGIMTLNVLHSHLQFPFHVQSCFFLPSNLDVHTGCEGCMANSFTCGGIML